MTIKGQDWAGYQPAKPSTSGLSFTFIKATEGTSYINPNMASQASTARAAGLVVGFYAFVHTGNIQAQAEYFVEKCASVDGDILACDWETDPSTGKHPTCAEKDAFIKAVKKLRPTHRTVLYCNVSYWKTIDTTSYCGDGLWIADPSHAAGKPAIDHPWTFHQYGISGADVDVANFATKAALKTWATGTTPPAPPTPPEPNVESNTEMLEDLTGNLLHIGSLSEKDAKGDPVEHGAGYYLAHTHYDALQVHDQAARIEDSLTALTAKTDTLTKALADLAAVVASLIPPKS
jgi:hypothetical protein